MQSNGSPAKQNKTLRGTTKQLTPMQTTPSTTKHNNAKQSNAQVPIETRVYFVDTIIDGCCYWNAVSYCDTLFPYPILLLLLFGFQRRVQMNVPHPAFHIALTHKIAVCLPTSSGRTGIRIVTH
jgi:hypothetical protein